MTTHAEVYEAFQRREAARKARTDPFAEGIAWVAGEVTPPMEARIPLLDQGFLHSDLTYDVAGVWDGRFFRLDDHLDRLEASAAKLRMPMPMARQALRALLIDLVGRSGLTDAYVEPIVTRGMKFVRERGGPFETKLYILILPFVWIQPLSHQDRGLSAVVTRTVRRVPPGAFDPTIKNLQWGDLVKAYLEAQDREAAYPLLPDGDGNLTEGSGYNIFLVKDGALLTPRRGVLEGVTRKTVFDIAAEKGWKVVVDEIPVEAAYTCDEIFLSSTAGGIMPINQLDGKPVGGGQVGPVTRQIWERYWDLHGDPRYSFAVDYPARVSA